MELLYEMKKGGLLWPPCLSYIDVLVILATASLLLTIDRATQVSFR
jgi:hypothetical protein